MINGPVSVWRGRHKEINSYLTGGALILGKPDEVIQPQTIIGRPDTMVLQPSLGQQKRQKLGKVGGGKQAHITAEKYIAYRKKGLSKDQICERTNITIGTLRTRLKEWGYNDPEAERKAIRDAT